MVTNTQIWENMIHETNELPKKIFAKDISNYPKSQSSTIRKTSNPVKMHKIPEENFIKEDIKFNIRI